MWDKTHSGPIGTEETDTVFSKCWAVQLTGGGCIGEAETEGGGAAICLGLSVESQELSQSFLRAFSICSFTLFHVDWAQVLRFLQDPGLLSKVSGEELWSKLGRL